MASIDEYSLQSDPKLNFTLQDGDSIFIPKRSTSISVVGEVLNSTTLLFKEDLSIQDYIDLAGGTTDGLICLEYLSYYLMVNLCI